MKDLFAAFGFYNIRARLSIGVILIAPWLLELYLFVPEIQKISSTAIILIILYSLCNVFIISCRVFGTAAMNKCFPDLLPAQAALLPSSTFIDVETKKRYYRFLSEHVEGFNISDEDTSMKPSACTAITWLIEQTRDSEKFPLIAEEGTNFGLSYTLLGLKPIGMFLCCLGMAINGLLLYFNHINYFFSQPASIVFGICINILFLLLWIFIINNKLVKSSGKKYARALLAACDSPYLK